MKQFIKFYVLEKSATLPFFHNGHRCMFRHELNNRKRADTRRRYTDLILKNGIMTECRSEIVAVQLKPNAWHLVAGATLVEAAYLAIEHDSTNRYVVSLLNDGLPHVKLLDARTPADALKWQKSIGNSFNSIASQESFIEVLDLVLDIETAWRAKRRSVRKKASPAGGPVSAHI